ncbi:MAG: UDP-glucose--hexose-1-phosphate uridylyltransferase [Myxococcota bacterium]
MVMTFDPSNHPHRRYNPLRGSWIVVSPHRTKRPWQGRSEAIPSDTRPQYDSSCYLCPGNERAGGAHNPRYPDTFAFTNDFAALLPDTPQAEPSGHPLLRDQAIRGTCRVLCFHPRHDLTMAEMNDEQRQAVVAAWIEQAEDLGQRYRWVQIFENRGQMMGSSNPHPHGQIWATDYLPDEAAREDAQQRAYRAEHGRPLLLDYIELERERGERVVVDSEHWTAVVPYWAMWPFETLLVPRRHVRRLPELEPDERAGLAAILGALLVKYDNLFEAPFAYSMGWHGAPSPQAASADYGIDHGVRNDNSNVNASDDEHWQLHAHFYPPLLRSATVRKFMVGFEMLAEAQRDITAEQAAERLRAAAAVHYRQRAGADREGE